MNGDKNSASAEEVHGSRDERSTVGSGAQEA